MGGRWGTVCGDGWTEREAALVCNRLGYPEISRSTYYLHAINEIVYFSPLSFRCKAPDVWPRLRPTI